MQKKNNLLIIPLIVGILMFSYVTEEPDVQANQNIEYTPYYMTEEYQRMKENERKEQEQEAVKLRASIEKYQEDQEQEAERLFQKQTKTVDDQISTELYLFANCVEAESGNQDDLGKRLVADVILNRVDDPDFPDTITEVISQKFQFSSYWDGGMDRWKPTDDTIKICREEMKSRQYTSLLYFTAGYYNPYGTPAFIHGDHYFSTK